MNDKQYSRMSDKEKHRHTMYLRDMAHSKMEDDNFHSWQTEHKAYDVGVPSEEYRNKILEARRKNGR